MGLSASNATDREVERPGARLQRASSRSTTSRGAWIARTVAGLLVRHPSRRKALRSPVRIIPGLAVRRLGCELRHGVQEPILRTNRRDPRSPIPLAAMPMPWTDPIRRARVLHVHAAPSIDRGPWRAVFRQALQEFTRLSRSNALGVTLERVDRQEDAEVTVEAASRAIDREYDGARIQQGFDGTRLHGYTALASRDGEIERAFVFLPSTPLVNTPRGQRQVGDPVKLLIAVHELVHACGLTNADHSSDDLFLGVPNVDPGDRPEGDRVRIRYDLRMPPLSLAGGTVTKVREIWG